MKTASLELFQELYELSGWVPDADDQIGSYSNFGSVINDEEYTYVKGMITGEDDKHHVPGYTLGYMLRKLPPVIQEEGKFLALQINFQGDGTFHMAYCEPYDKEFRGSYITNADVLENGVASLAIKLFKKSILKKQPEGGIQ